jgi:hypothetical protein
MRVFGACARIYRLTDLDDVDDDDARRIAARRSPAARLAAKTPVVANKDCE